VGIARHKLAYVLLGAGRLDDTQQELLAALQIETRSRDQSTVRARSLQADLARLHMATGRPRAAEQAWAVALAPQPRSAPPVVLARWQRDQAQTLIWLKRPAEAAPLLAQALAVHQQIPGNDAVRLRSELVEVELALSLRHTAQAAKLLDSIDARLPATFPELHHAAWALRGQLAAQAGNAAEAERWLGQAWREALTWKGRPHPGLLPIGIERLAVLVATHPQDRQVELVADLQRCALSQDEASPWRVRLRAMTAAP
jgi:tetratricopeptide (TPR) repeat protein